MASTTEDQATIEKPITTVPAYDPANPYPVMRTPYTGYDQYLLSTTKEVVAIPPRGY